MQTKSLEILQQAQNKLKTTKKHAWLYLTKNYNLVGRQAFGSFGTCVVCSLEHHYRWRRIPTLTWSTYSTYGGLSLSNLDRLSVKRREVIHGRIVGVSSWILAAYSRQSMTISFLGKQQTRQMLQWGCVILGDHVAPSFVIGVSALMLWQIKNNSKPSTLNTMTTPLPQRQTKLLQVAPGLVGYCNKWLLLPKIITASNFELLQ